MRRADREPDRRSAEVVTELLEGFAAEGLTVIVVTHDQQPAGSMRRLLEIDDGVVTERAGAAQAGSVRSAGDRAVGACPPGAARGTRGWARTAVAGAWRGRSTGERGAAPPRPR
jgi:energy-coupling factor transporter ATP-binding protein EcfA2